MPRIMLTLTDQLLEFLDGQSAESGIDRSNLIRARLWNWRTEERDRKIAEEKVMAAEALPPAARRARKGGAAHPH